MPTEKNQGSEPKKFAVIDLETTGLNPHQHEIIEIGLVLTQSPAFKIEQECEWKVRPERLKSADPKALEIAGYDPKLWQKAVSLQEAMQELSEMTENAIMVAHNISFDWNFLQEAFLQTGVPDKMHYHRLDLLSMAYARLFCTGQVQRYNLESLAAYFGVPLDRTHRHGALEDARATYEIFVKLLLQS